MKLRHHTPHPVLFIDHRRFRNLYHDKAVIQTMGINNPSHALHHILLMKMPSGKIQGNGPDLNALCLRSLQK